MFSQLNDYLINSEVFKEFKFQKNKNINISSTESYPLSLFFSLLFEEFKYRTWIICPTEELSKEVITNLTALNKNYILLNSSGTVLYSPYVEGNRSYEMLNGLASMDENSFIVTSIRAFCSPMISKASLSKTLLEIKRGDTVNFTEISGVLAESGYYRADIAFSPGDFSLHGEVLDIFPFGKNEPYRIYLDWDSVKKICTYNPDSQLVTGNLDKLNIQLVNSSSDIKLNERAVLDYLDTEKDLFIFYGFTGILSSYNSLVNEAKSVYRSIYKEKKSVEDLSHPDELLLNIETFSKECRNTVFVNDFKEESEKEKIYDFDIEAPRSYFGNITFLKDDITGLSNNDWNINIISGTKIQQDRLVQLLSDFNNINFNTLKISSGFSLPEKHLIVITDTEIFGHRKRVIKTLQTVKTDPLSTFTDLHEGDYVVHVNYGIGKFVKIERLHERDYIKILFADNNTLYVPIEQANLIQKYIGSSGEAPKMDKLGSNSWESKKAKARKSAEDLANHLINLYAKRQNSHGFAFNKDNDWQLRFESLFEFEETEDQISCIQDIKDDMEKPIVMDRLICGDVGYGKTELAFRAVFKAVMSGKQAAFLAPTTILAEQHFRNFKERAKSFPITIGLLTRMVSSSDIRKTLKGLKEGSIDVVFGTHRLIQKDVVFSNPGLLVVDEEQRFGVKDKERIKSFKTNIDCLTLSATPIPRTLYMSLLKIRDMSLLTTAPIQRKPIKTVIKEFDLSLVKQAIEYEINRHGQVYYLHNRIDTLEETANMLKSLVPSAVIETANGQMDGDILEDVMRRFIYEGINVLVSTTIIENGIDIPNVNTIIIDRADMYGASQLYQLRGRVGRGSVQAMAYLLYPSNYGISEQAIKRLRIISENTELGSGFKVAMKDMEIRGAGNILGKEQSGFMASVGLDMYLRLLDEEIYKLKNNEEKPDDDVYLEMDYSGFIPDSYISDPSVKFEVYKKIACVKTKEELDNLTAQLRDRFGTLDDSIYNLLYISELKIICRKIDVYHIKENAGNVSVEFSKISSINMSHLINMIQTSNGAVKIDPKKLNFLYFKTEGISLKDKALFILEKLQRLM